MNDLSVIEVGTIIAIIGCFVGLAGWLASRDKRLATDAQWRGTVDAKLDLIVGMGADMEKIQTCVSTHGERLASLENESVRLRSSVEKLQNTISRGDRHND